ncbi:MAG: response regulator [Spirochaetaceae bacterium]
MEQHRGHLLLVEDEMVIALNESRILTSAGYRVSLATSGEEAIGLVDADPSLGAVLLDLDLGPGVSGAQAAKVMRAIRPAMPIIFFTTYDPRQILHDLDGLEGCPHLLKSEGGAAIVAALEEILAAVP